VSNFNNKLFAKPDGTRIKINAWAGMWFITFQINYE
jgi:hypothetical protein